MVHAQLVRFIQASDRRVLGENNANLPRIVEVFVKVLGKGEKLVDGDTARAMAVLLHQMQVRGKGSGQACRLPSMLPGLTLTPAGVLACRSLCGCKQALRRRS